MQPPPCRGRLSAHPVEAVVCSAAEAAVRQPGRGRRPLGQPRLPSTHLAEAVVRHPAEVVVRPPAHPVEAVVRPPGKVAVCSSRQGRRLSDR